MKREQLGLELETKRPRQGTNHLRPVKRSKSDAALAEQMQSIHINDLLFNGKIKNFREAMTKAIEAYCIEIKGFQDAGSKELWSLQVAQCERALAIYTKGKEEAQQKGASPEEAQRDIAQKLRDADLNEFALGLEANDYCFLSF